jgi:NitT/TauT family transport system ATP-binding protein
LPDTPPRLAIRDLDKVFQEGEDRVHAFGQISLEARPGEFLCVVGPSGCGKTTLLRCIAGIETPSAGSMERQLEPGARGAEQAMVFQQHGLFPWLTVEANLHFVLRESPVPREQHADIVQRLLDRVGLLRFRRFYPYQLSGGMNQRVALVRAFCVQPQVLLMDEPFVFLDYQNRIILQDLLLELWAEQRQTIVFVSHNINEAIALGDRVLVMPGMPGPFVKQIACPFPRPRDIVELRTDPTYQRIVVEVTRLLRQEQERSLGAGRAS